MPLKTFKRNYDCIRFDDRRNRLSSAVRDKSAPIRNVYDRWNNNLKCMSLGKNVTVDEQLISFRGRCPFRYYIPLKPAKYGIKMWIEPYIARRSSRPKTNDSTTICDKSRPICHLTSTTKRGRCHVCTYKNNKNTYAIRCGKYAKYVCADLVWHSVDLRRCICHPPSALFSFSRVKSSLRLTTQELRSCLWNGSTYGDKLRKMYLTRSELSRPGVFLLVTNLLVTILKARPHGPFSTSPIKSFQH